MKKRHYISRNSISFLWLFVLLLVGASCQQEDQLTPSASELYPPDEQSELDKALINMFDGFNTRIEYRYIKNLLPNDWYFITPVDEDIVLPMSQLLIDLMVQPLLAGANPEFVSLTFPKLLVYVGSPAYKLDGTRVLGQAEGGTLIRFTEVNQFDLTNANWLNTQLHTAFHEYGHIIHQRFGLPNEYREVTPDEYTKNGWRIVTNQGALRKGVVTPYGTSNVSEDFVELFSLYIVSTQTRLDNFFVDVEGEVDNNKGRNHLRNKLNILTRYMASVGVNMLAIRESYQAKLAELTTIPKE